MNLDFPQSTLNMKNNLTFRIESSFDFKQFIYSNCVEIVLKCLDNSVKKREKSSI
jgi:hypothetical protein